MSNDWLALQLYNPDITFDDLSKLDVNAENTILKSREDYVNMPQIQEAFRKQDGSFDQDKFDKYYDSALRTYNTFISEEFDKQVYDDYIYSPYDTTPYSEDQLNVPQVAVKHVPNPFQKTNGISNMLAEPMAKLSVREAAQNAKVFDYETGEFLDWTPNDPGKSGIGFLGIPTLVLATWDEDGTHLENGIEVKHQKGEYKFNEYGSPYYETLGNRDASTKDILRFSDTLTTDGSAWNKWDPFDSDGLEKSTRAIVADTILNLVPYFIPYIGTAYKVLQIAKGSAKVFGVLGKAGSELMGINEGDGLWNMFNALDATASKFSPTQSDEGKESLFTLEGIAGIVKDSANQLYSQRTIAQIPRVLKLNPLNNKAINRKLVKDFGEEYLDRYGKNLATALKDGTVNDDFLKTMLTSQKGTQAISRAMNRYTGLSKSLGASYMAGIQAADVYNTMKEHDWDEYSTAAGLIGTYLGYYWLMRHTSLGEVALRGLGFDDTKRVAKKWTEEQLKDLQNVLNTVDKSSSKGKLEGIKKAFNFVKSTGQRIVGPETLTDMTREGIEEVSEEMLADGVLGLISSANYLTGGESHYNPFQENMLERYLASGFGGFIGGGVFRGLTKMETSIDNIRNARNAEVVKNIPEDTFNDLITVIRNGGGKTVKETIQRMIDKGKIAPTKLSLQLNNSTDNKKAAFNTTQKKDESQNDLIGNYLLSFVDSLDRVINNGGLAIPDNEVVESALNKDIRLARLANDNGKVAKDILKEFNTTLSDIVKAKMDPDDSDANKKIINEGEKRLQAMLNGDMSKHYTERLMFDMMPGINYAFGPSNVELYAYTQGKVYNSLNDEEKQAMQKQFDSVKDKYGKYYAFEAYNKLKKDISPLISDTKLNGSIESIKAYTEAINKALQAFDTNLTEEDLKKLLEDTRAELKKNGKLYNERDYTDEQWENWLKNDENIKKSPVYQRLIDQKRVERLNKAFMERPNTQLLGTDPAIISALDPDENIELTNIETLVNELYNTRQTTGISIDQETYNRLNNLRNYVNNINALELINKFNLAQAFDRIGNTIETLSQTATIYDEGDEIEGVNPDVSLQITRNDDGTYNVKGEYTPDNVDEEDILRDLTKDYEETKDVTVKVADFNIPGIVDGNSIRFEFNTNDEATVSELIKAKVGLHAVNSWSELNENTDFGKYVIGKDKQTLERKKKITEQIDEISAIRNNDSLMQMISKVSTLLTGQDALKLFETESGIYQRLSSPRDYTINSSIVEEQLRNISNVANVVSALIKAQTDDANEAMQYAKNLQADDQTALLTQQDALQLNQSLERLLYNIDFLLNVNDFNKGNKILDSKQTFVRLGKGLLYHLAAANHKIYYEDTNGNKFNLLSDILTQDETNKANAISADSTDANDNATLWNIIKQANRRLSEKFNSLNDDQKAKLIEDIAGNNIFTKDYNPTVIDKHMTQDSLRSNFIAQYILLNALTPASVQDEFWKNLSNEIALNNLYPFAGQLLDIYMTYLWAQKSGTTDNSETLNKYLDLLRQSDKIEAHQNYRIRLDMIFNLGKAGSGKTSIVAKYVYSLLNKQNQPTIFIAGPKLSTAQKLGRALDSNNKNVFSKDDLLKQLLTESGLEKYYGDNGLAKTEQSLNSNQPLIKVDEALNKVINGYTKADIKTDNLPDYIFIDEITHFSRGDIALLNDISNKSGKRIKIIGFGDNTQSGITDSGGRNISSTQEFNISNPVLNMNVRSDNTTKQENVGRLGNLSSLVSDKRNEAIRNKVNLNPGPYRDLLLNEFRLKYYNDNNKVFHGEQVVSEVDKQLLQNLKDGLKEHEVIAYIGDITSQRATDLKNLLGDKLVLVSSNDVQGEEYKYTIIDVEWNTIDANTSLTEFTNELAKLYTLLSRSSVGSFIINNNNNNFQLKSERVNQSHEIELNQDDLGGYREFLSQILPLASVSAQGPSIPESTQEVGNITITGDPIVGDVEPSKQFLDKHAQVFTHFKTEVKGNEDFRGLNLEVNELRVNTLLKFKQLLVNNTPINELLDETTNQTIVDIFNTVHGNLGITKDQIKKGSYKLKVYPATSGDIIPEFGDNFNTGSKVVKLVYQIPMGTNTVDIVLGHVRNDVNNAVDNLKFGEGTAYYNINNPKFQNRKFELRRIDSEFWNDRNNRESHTLDKIRNAHPELVITDPMIISNKDGTAVFDSKFNVVRDLNNVAKPIVLVSSDITLTKDQILEKYVTWLNNGCKTPLPDIGVLELKPKGFTSEEFFNLWKSTLVNNNPNIGKNDLNSLNAVYLGAKFLQTLDKFFKEPKTEDGEKAFAQATGVEFKDAKQAYTRQIYEIFSDSGYGNSNRAPIVKIPTVLETKDLASTLSPEGQAHFKNVILPSYNTKKDSKKSGIQVFIETLNTHKDDKELSAEDKDKIANIAKDLQQALDDIDIGVVLENSGALFYRLLSNGILAPISTGAIIISRLSRMRDADSALGKAIDYALNTSPSFKFGIIVNPIASKGMFHQDRIFTQAGLGPNQFYVDAEVYSQRIYFNSSNIESNNTPAPEPTNEIQVGTPDPVRVAADNSAALHQLMRDVDTNLYNLGLADVSRILTNHLGTITNDMTPEELVTQMNNLLDSWNQQVIYDRNGVPVDTFGNIRIKYADGKVSIAKLGERYTEGNYSFAFTDYPREDGDLLFSDSYGNTVAKVPEWEIVKFAFVSPNTFYLKLGNTSYKAVYENGTVTLTEENSPFELEQVDENCT